jgi:hypothetical protein
VLYAQAIQNDTTLGTLTVNQLNLTGYVASEELFETLFADERISTPRVVCSGFSATYGSKDRVVAWDKERAVAFTTFDVKSNRFSVLIAAPKNEEFFLVFEEWFKKNSTQKTKSKGKVFMLTSTPQGIQTVAVGFAAVPLMLSHYESQAQEKIVRVAKNLKEQWPDGRLTILEGPPGCGKTFLVRSLIAEVPDANFIFVPPSLVRSLGDPSFTSALLAMRDPDADNEDFLYSGPTVLICEDADDILLSRGSDNMSSISSLLNLTAGILSDVVDIRIIATTNADKNKIDPAALRNGRLSEYVKVGPLPLEQATSVLNELMGKDQGNIVWPAAKAPNVHGRNVGFSGSGEIEIAGKVLLADVFKEAKARGWSPPKRQKAEAQGESHYHLDAENLAD